MTASIFKVILAGILIGAVAFFAFKVFIAFLVFGLIFMIFGRIIHGKHGYGGHRLAFADHIRTMSDEEYAGFKNRMTSGCCPCHHSSENCKNNQIKK